MKYDSRMGIAYDTIFYGVLYFNFDRLKENYQKYPDISDEDFHLFYTLKEQISARTLSLLLFRRIKAIFYIQPFLLSFSFWSRGFCGVFGTYRDRFIVYASID